MGVTLKRMPRSSSVLSSGSFLSDPELVQLFQALEEAKAKLSADGSQALDSLAELLAHGGAFVFPCFRRWAEEESPQLRKALVQVIGKAADPKDPFRAVFLFSLIDPLLWDEDPAVRRSARRVLREKLLSVYPEESLEVLAQWASDPAPEKRAFAASLLPLLPERMAKRALILLRCLARTEEEKVRRAVRRSLEILRKRAPKALDEELKRWEADPFLSALLLRG